MKNILVAIDLDKNAKKLILQASRLAEKFKSKLWIIHVAPVNPDIIGYKYIGLQYVPQERAKELRKEHRTIQRYAQQLNTKGIRAVGLLLEGGTLKTVLDESKKLKIDFIVIGSHKHNIFFKALADITSSKLIRQSKIPIMVVPLD